MCPHRAPPRGTDRSLRDPRHHRPASPTPDGPTAGMTSGRRQTCSSNASPLIHRARSGQLSPPTSGLAGDGPASPPSRLDRTAVQSHARDRGIGHGRPPRDRPRLRRPAGGRLASAAAARPDPPPASRRAARRRSRPSDPRPARQQLGQSPFGEPLRQPGGRARPPCDLPGPAGRATDRGTPSLRGRAGFSHARPSRRLPRRG
jgi:hypothetical protein